jgi:hypothetical protein
VVLILLNKRLCTDKGKPTIGDAYDKGKPTIGDAYHKRKPTIGDAYHKRELEEHSDLSASHSDLTDLIFMLRVLAQPTHAWL